MEWGMREDKTNGCGGDVEQNPIYEDQPVVKKALIVCPVTLINNWRREFRKWLDDVRIGVLVVDAKTNLRDFIVGKTYSVLIIGYEKVCLGRVTVGDVANVIIGGSSKRWHQN
jgi:SNF2 family DNA or RNA helicase